MVYFPSTSEIRQEDGWIHHRLCLVTHNYCIPSIPSSCVYDSDRHICSSLSGDFFFSSVAPITKARLQNTSGVANEEQKEINPQ
mmetsp:Transcript_22653/g.27354  ORF Transcript_22653/g.27354 Transcript_22653/m.27354 type:complete len:84 (-) Transcript_22653:784-1035(-)